ncbi:MAG: substrate-binding domain-containing protein [Actinobacteria bacterium]|nr:substrate-binding domain-containing protein [Actinomycetota bacterium]
MAGLAVGVLGLLTVVLPAPPAVAGGYAVLGGDGSSFAAPAIDQWATDVQKQGITINYAPDGSAAGRQNYAENQADFAGTDIQFLTSPDPFGGGAEVVNLAYSYVPVVAGGTAFMYNLVVGGHTITDLRLSGLTIAKIFTGAITNWADPAITRDYGAQLPSQPITVITRSDGSGASYQFTRYLAHEFPALWNGFCAHNGGPPSNCGPTEFYPNFSGSQQKNGSDQVANYVASSSYGEGSIAYDEYSYAKSRSLPVVKLLNAAGYYTLPTASNVAIALQAAKIDENPNDVNFLIQNLDGVYGYGDARAYPVSSYSYLVVPRDSRPGTSGPPSRFNNDKGRTLSTWLNYVLCGAQQSAGQLGYSPLPKNLVVGGFEQVLHIPGHVGVPNLDQLSNCNNPTYSDGVNHLIADAPMPSPCDKIGSPLNCVVRNGQAASGGSQSAGSGGGTAGGGSGTSGGGSGGSANAAGSRGTTPTVSAAGGHGARPSVDPVTGQLVNQNGTGTDGNAASAVPVSLDDRSSGRTLFSILTAVELLAAVTVPAALGIWLQRRRRTTP